MKKIKNQNLTKPKGIENRKLDPDNSLLIDLDISFDENNNVEENTRSAFYRIMYEANYRDIPSEDLERGFELIRFDLLGKDFVLQAIEDSYRTIKARNREIWQDCSMLANKWKDVFGYTSFLDLLIKQLEEK